MEKNRAFIIEVCRYPACMYLEYGTQNYFSLTEVAEIMGTSKEEAFKEMMRVGAVKPSSSQEQQQFIIPPTNYNN